MFQGTVQRVIRPLLRVLKRPSDFMYMQVENIIIIILHIEYPYSVGGYNFPIYITIYISMSTKINNYMYM